jgi:lipoprotein-releasing system permease protein
MFEWFVAKRFLFEGRNFFPKGSAKIGVIAVAIGVAVMIIAMATARGLQYEVTKKLESFSGTFTLKPYSAGEALNLGEVPEWENTQFVARQQAVIERPGVLRNASSYAGLLFKGVFDDFDRSTWKNYLTKGDWLDLSKPESLVLSEEIARTLSLQLGDTVYGLFPKAGANAQQRRFVVNGLFDSQYAEFDRSVVLVSGQMMRRLNQFSEDQVSSVELFVSEGANIDRAASALIEQLPPEIDLISTRSEQSMLFDWIKLFDLNLLIISLVITVVGALNMVSSLLAVVFEKASAVGLLRALGATERSLRKLFWIQGAYFLAVGLGLGNAIALAAYSIQHQFHLVRFADPKEYYVDYIPVKLYGLEVLLLNGAVFVLCAMVLWAVSKIAVRIHISRLVGV